jgi:hypothetical protein
MKRFILLLSVLFLFAHCDKVPPRTPPVPPECVLNTPVVNTNTATSNSRKVLLEDYTGHYCGQCPPAAKKAEDIIAIYGENVVVLANHVSITHGEPRKNYNEDFRDPASTEWDQTLGMSGVGLPCGSVNRIKAPTYRVGHSAWEGLVESELQKSQTVKLDVTTMYDLAQNLLQVKVFATFKKAFPFNVSLQMVLTQDSIIGTQADYLVAGGKVSNYRWDHIMTKAINGTWGQSLKTAPKLNDTITVIKNCFTAHKVFMSDSWKYNDPQTTNDRHLNVVVFAFNTETKEVLQVEKVKIR